MHIAPVLVVHPEVLWNQEAASAPEEAAAAYPDRDRIVVHMSFAVEAFGFLPAPESRGLWVDIASFPAVNEDMAGQRGDLVDHIPVDIHHSSEEGNPSEAAPAAVREGVAHCHKARRSIRHLLLAAFPAADLPQKNFFAMTPPVPALFQRYSLPPWMPYHST